MVYSLRFNRVCDWLVCWGGDKMKLPHIVKYTDKVQAGNARLFYVRINPRFKDDKGMHAHEYEHVKQWYASLPIAASLWLAFEHFAPYYAYFFVALIPFGFSALYQFVKPFRYWTELRAFNAYLKEHDYKPRLIDWASNAIANDYGLSVSASKVKTDLFKLREG